MTRNWYAINARDLLEQRQHGHKPPGPISVVMDGSNVDSPALYLRSDMPVDRMDWRMLVDCEVWLWASLTTPFDRLERVARDIAEVVPSRLVVRFTDRSGELHDIEVGSGSHRKGIPDLGIAPEHEFIWCPINLSGTTPGARMKRALARTRHADHH